jgi:hypothetical protein
MSTWNSSPQRELTTNPLSGKLGADQAAAIGTDVKGRASNLMYGLGIGLSFANRWAGIAAYVAVALMWLIPDRRVERTLSGPHEDRGRIPP